MNTLEYLSAVKVTLGVRTDYMLAKRMHVSQQLLCNYRHGRSRMDDDMALKVALILGIDPLEPIAQANYERARDVETRNLWGKVLERFARPIGPAIRSGKKKAGPPTGRPDFA